MRISLRSPDHRMRRAIVLLSLLCLPVVSAADEDALWQTEFELLLNEMAHGYANLDWSAERRGLDLPAMAAEARAS